MEYEYLFTKSLFEYLKPKVKGKVFCKVINDILIVNIDTKEGIDYGYTLENFAEKLKLEGLASDSLGYEIVNLYRKEVIKRFFY